MLSEKKVQISAKQFAMLSVTLVLSTADVFLPAFVAQEARNDAWISVIIGTLFAIIVANILITLGLKFPDKTLIEYSCDIAGKAAGKAIGFIYAVFFLLLTWTVIRELDEIFVTAFNPTSNIYIYSVIVVIVAMYSLSQGIEVIARLNEILLPLGLIILLLVSVLNIPSIDLAHFLPVLYKGISFPLRGAFFIQGWLVEVVVFLQLVPFVKEKEKVRKYLNISMIITSASLLAGVLTIAVFGPDLTAKLLLPALEYVRLANLGSYIQNLDISIMVVWVSGIFVKITLCLYVGTLAFSQVFNLKSYKPMIFPLGFLVVVFSATTSKMLSDLIYVLKYNIPFLNLFMALVLPGLLLIILKIRNFGSNKLGI